ncbi:MAG: aspartate kinase [Treponema sp.]|nr:aspartate kinase [Treponema sp.]
MIVMKFGGSSLADASRLRHVADIVKTQLDKKPVLVLSAMGDTTDHLLTAGNLALNEGKVEFSQIEKLHLTTLNNLKLPDGRQNPVQIEVINLLDELRRLLSGISLIKELSPRTKDYLVSFGERLCVRIVTAYLKSTGLNAFAFDAWEIGFLSNSNNTHAELSKDSWNLIPDKVKPLIKKNVIPVVTGFLAKDENGNITTLGRGGSDLSATMIAAACKADEAQIWKDVDGILSADPRIVKNPKPVQSITYDEAAELAYFGAQVLHPRAMLPCMKTGTPVIIKNSYNVKAPGTKIEQAAAPKKTTKTEMIPVRTITSKHKVTLVDIVSTRMVGQHGFLEEVFSIFAKYNISIDMVATSEVSVSLTLDDCYDLGEVKKHLNKIASVEIKTGKAIISIIGDVKRSSEILGWTFVVCQRIGVNVQMVSLGASKVNISFIVNDNEAAKVIRALHVDFFD